MAYLCIIGFSTAIRGELASRQLLKKWADCFISSHKLRSCSHLTPELQSLVQGGWAIMRSQGCLRSGVTSPVIWGPGCSEGSRSQEMALKPAARKAVETIPENSHAMRIFIVIGMILQ